MTVRSSPRVLGNVAVTLNHDKKLYEVMRQNWMRIHAHVVKQPLTWAGEETLRKMLLIELHEQRRMDVVKRLFGRIMTLQRDLLEKDLLATL